jgi:photosystem II stability/assembly factor-like uncharacterized protein
MKNPVYILVLCLLSLSMAAQKDTTLNIFKNMSMRSIGPSVMSGRVTAIDVLDHDENTVYVGTASGGLWKSENGGTTWKSLFDKEEITSIGSLCIDPSAQDIIWAGTGEGNPRNSQTSGAGIYRSPDAGRTWKKMGLENSFTIHRVIVDPNKSEIVYAGVHGSAWGPNTERGVFRTKNNGSTWEKILYVNDSVGCADLVMDPQNPNKLFAAMYQYQRKAYYFNSGGKGSGLHMTTDGGNTWIKLTDKHGLPDGELGRIGIAVAASNPKVVYALIEAKKTGLYKSKDGGYSWSLVNDQNVGDRPFYYHEIYVDPTNENHLIYLHSIVSESIDGGKTWSVLLPYSGVHPDHHAFWWSKKNSKLMMEGNDGGFNISRDGGDTWTFINNLPLGQFYHVDFDMDVPYHVYGGMQDNGSWKGSGYTWHGAGINASDWQEVLFGDGFDVLPHKINSRYVYAMSQGGEVNYVDSETGDARNIKPVHPDGLKLRFNWNAAIAEDPNNECGVYFGSQFLHHSTDCGYSWKIISPDLTTNDSAIFKMPETGGLTADVTGAENYCTLLCIAPSKKDNKTIWVGTDDGQVQLTTDGGNSWQNISSSISGLPKSSWIPQIVASEHHIGEAFVVVNNYRNNDWKPYLFHTLDNGKTWKNLVDDKKVSGHCLSIVQDPIEKKLLFLGTEHGLYISFDYGNKWHKWTKNYPSVPTQDLKIHPREYDLIIGTFGRAIYILDNISPLRKYAAEGASSFDKKLIALPIAEAYLASYIQQKGERFPGDHFFHGQNKSFGAQLNYYFQPETETKKTETASGNSDDKKSTKQKQSKEKIEPLKNAESKNESDTKKDKKVTIRIFSMAGDTLRTFKSEPDTGLNYVSWYFDTKGVMYPTRKERKDEQDEPGGGISVAPGKYKVTYAYNDRKDSSTFEVKNDPRLDWNQNLYEKNKSYSVRLQKAIQLADDAFESLKAAKKNIEMVNSALTNVPDSLKKDILTMRDSLNKTITAFQNSFMDMDDKPGYHEESHLLMTKIYSASSYSGNSSVGENAENALKYLETETRKIADQINTFFENDWRSWRSQVEKIQFSLFNTVKKL